MRTFFYAFCCLLLLSSCDDGDIIVTTFDFDDEALQLCEDFQYVFFKVNNDNNETLALQLITEDPFLFEPDTYTFDLNQTNVLTYRRLDDNVNGASYFCQPLPPSNPQVLEEFTANAGTLTIVTTGTQDDNDGISAEQEGVEFEDDEFTPDLEASQDTDGDGLPDFIDIDDDGDNVPTAQEGVVFLADGVSIDMENSLDTDGDGILDYLDPDDDGDGILTINEDIDQDLDPTNDRPDLNTEPNYLNPLAVEVVSITAYREHSYTFSNVRLTLSLTNLVFRDASGEQVIRDQTVLFLGDFNAPSATITRPVVQF